MPIPVINCPLDDKRGCPNEWETLPDRTGGAARPCPTCGRDVYYPDSDFDYEMLRRIGAVVALGTPPSPTFRPSAETAGETPPTGEAGHDLVGDPPTEPPDLPDLPPPPPLRWSVRDDSFLQAIREDHASDGPRLVYADWLEEQGDSARAELIRVQCELARLDPSTDRARELTEREGILLREHGHAWTLGLDRRFSFDGGSFTFRRGFVEELTCRAYTPEGFLAEGQRLLRHHPVRKLVVGGSVGVSLCPLATDDCRKLASCPALARIRDLDCCLADYREGLPSLLASPHLADLECLRLRFFSGIAVEPDREAMTALAASSLLARLIRLDLSRCPTWTFANEQGIGTTALGILLGSAHFGLRDLALRGRFEPEVTTGDYPSPATTVPCVGPEGLVLLAESPAVARLRCLDVVHNGLDARAIEAMLRSPYLRGVSHLIVGEFESPILETYKARLRQHFAEHLALFPSPCQLGKT